MSSHSIRPAQEEEVLVSPHQWSRPNTALSTSSSRSLGDQRSSAAVPNPFSPPGSTTHLEQASNRTHSGHRAVMSSDSLYLPQNGFHSATTSVVDFSGASSLYSGGSRPGTAGSRPGTGVSRVSSSRLRESFASPRPRQLKMYRSLQRPQAKVQRERPKSTMLSARGPVEKPWITTRDPSARIAYFLTYGMMLLGVAASAIRCWFSWRDTPMLPANLCLVMDENFDSADGIFGENGKFFREVDMSGFG